MPTNLTDMDLAGLIRRTKGDRSYEQLAASSSDSPSRQRWQQMGSQTGPSDLPKPKTVRAIADALGVSERVVVLAAARTAGLTVGENASSIAALLPPSADRLSDSQVTAVLAVIRAILEPRTDDATPTKTPGVPTPDKERPAYQAGMRKQATKEADDLLRDGDRNGS